MSRQRVPVPKFRKRWDEPAGLRWKIFTPKLKGSDPSGVFPWTTVTTGAFQPSATLRASPQSLYPFSLGADRPASLGVHLRLGEAGDDRLQSGDTLLRGHATLLIARWALGRG